VYCLSFLEFIIGNYVGVKCFYIKKILLGTYDMRLGIFSESLPQFVDLPSYVSGTITPQNQTYLQPFL